MKPAPFDYCAPTSLEEALSELSRVGGDQEAKLLAGGQSLIPAMNFRLARPAVLVDLGRLDELAQIQQQGEQVSLGAMVTQRKAELSAVVSQHVPLLAAALPNIAHPQIRNRGTVGGSLAHADPAAELPAVMLALDARFCIASQNGVRTVDASDFFLGLFTTALEPDEILQAIEVDVARPGEGCGFREMARRSGDYALAGVAARVQLDGDGRCTLARLSFFSVDDLPVRTPAAEDLLVGESPSGELLAEAAAQAEQEIDPGSDIHASAAFRRHLARGMAEQALNEAFERARSASPV